MQQSQKGSQASQSSAQYQLTVIHCLNSHSAVMFLVKCSYLKNEIQLSELAVIQNKKQNSLSLDMGFIYITLKKKKVAWPHLRAREKKTTGDYIFYDIIFCFKFQLFLADLSLLRGRRCHVIFSVKWLKWNATSSHPVLQVTGPHLHLVLAFYRALPSVPQCLTCGWVPLWSMKSLETYFLYKISKASVINVTVHSQAGRCIPTQTKPCNLVYCRAAQMHDSKHYWRHASGSTKYLNIKVTVDLRIC